METQNNKKYNQNELILQERLQLTLSICKRFKMSTAYCYIRFDYPLSFLQYQNDLESILHQQIQARLRGSIKEMDTLVRVSETDYVLLLMDITEDQSKLVLERISQVVTETYRIDFHLIDILCHIGVCMFPYGSDDEEQLRFIAKAEMFEAKKLGNNHIKIFQNNVHADTYRRLLIENDLAYALRNNQLYVQYQPQVCMKNMKIIGVEALIRWQHPTLGKIPPGEFIELAEKAGLMTDVFYWVFEVVCKQIGVGQNLHITYSINLSVNQLVHANLVERLTKIIQRYNIKPSLLTLEIVENIDIYTKSEVKDIMRQLKEMGFTIAIDDFGNGYFSFSDFIQLPIDFVKLDKNFVSSIIENDNYKQVVSSIITMAHQLGLTVIVEGIEDERQFNDWKSLEIDIIQGYYVCKPISVSELKKAIQKIEGKLKTS